MSCHQRGAWLRLTFGIALATSLIACESAQTSATPDYEGAIGEVARVLTESRADNKYALNRQTPEQVSHFVRQSLGVNLWDSDIDPIVTYYATALGGIDFQSTFERDPQTKVQTLLVAHALAWQVAMTLVFKEYNQPQADRILLKHVAIDEDWPDRDSAGADRWQQQLVEIYWRFYGREPNTAEIAAQQSAWLSITQDNGIYNGAPAFGWVAIVYAMLASQEYWNL